MFEPLWNNKYISNIQVTSSEVLGVEDRGGYYESLHHIFAKIVIYPINFFFFKRTSYLII
jgi:hypothetical protein